MAEYRMGRRSVFPVIGASAAGVTGLFAASERALAQPETEFIAAGRFQYYPYVDITAHGAEPGTADPAARRAAMQAAIDVAEFVGVRSVYVPPALWVIDDPLLLPDGLTLFGSAGRGSGQTEPGPTSEIKMVTGANNAVLRNADQTHGNHSITIRDLRIVAPQAAGSAISIKATGLDSADRCGHILIERCQIWRGGDIGIEWQKVMVSTIKGCQIGGNGTVTTGISLSASPDNWIVGNIVGSSHTGPALHIGDSSGATVVANNDGFEWSYQGILCESDRVTITGNMLRQNLREGILIDNAAGCVVTGNTFYNNGRAGSTVAATERAGVRLVGADCRGNSVTGNTHSKWDASQTDFQQWGVVLDSGSHHNAVVGNACADMDAGDVFEHATAHSNEVSANTDG